MIFAFTGRKGSGKDTLFKELRRLEWEGRALSEACGLGHPERPAPPMLQVRFAEKLKGGASLIYGLTHAQIEDRVSKDQIDPRWGLTPRQIMQGMNKLREIHPLTFILPTMEKCCDYFAKARLRDGGGEAGIWDATWGDADGELALRRQTDPMICITDLRRMDEAAHLVELGIAIDSRVVIVRITRPGNESDDNHESETEVERIDADFDLVNDDTPAYLAAQCLAMLVDKFKESQSTHAYTPKDRRAP